MRRGTLLIAACVVVGLAAAAALRAWTGLVQREVTPSPAATETDAPRWGLIGSYEGIDLDDLRRRGIELVLLELEWRRAEPRENAFDRAEFAELRDELRRFRDHDLEAVLSLGLHQAPDWLLDRPNARFTNQRGVVFAETEPNLIWATELRALAERYVAAAFEELGTEFAAVRVGGGHFGELTYPAAQAPGGGLHFDYWAFDAAAARTNPVPGWRPGEPSPNGEARRFLNWYLDGLTSFQNWQVGAVRHSYPGPIAVLYPSWGVREGDVAAAIAGNLGGTSSVERNGELQRGYDHQRHIEGLVDPGVIVWATWAEQPGTVSWLASLSAGRGLPLMAENAGHNSSADLARSVEVARRHRLEAFFWVRAEEAYCFCDGQATIDDLERAISATSTRP